jgi:hypothetical protein
VSSKATMKKMLLFLLTAGMAFNTLYAQSDWINYVVDPKLAVQVPSQPTKADQYSVMSVSVDSVIFIIRKADMKTVAGLDSATLAGLAASDQFASGIKSGMAENMKGYTLGDIREDRWHGYYSYAVNADNPTTKIMSYTFMFIIGDYLYSFIAILPEARDQKLKDRFFNSIKVN